MSIAAGQTSTRDFMSIAAGLHAGGWWRPEIRCGDDLAADHIARRVQSSGLSEPAAKRELMSEFSNLFQPGVSWNAEAQCEEHCAGARAEWLQNQKGMSARDARAVVMSEFVEQFIKMSDTLGTPGWQFVWRPNTLCGEHPAQGRCDWLQTERGFSLDAAQRRVAFEFPAQFVWHPEMQCDGESASARVSWLMDNKGHTFQSAADQVRSEFPELFVPASVHSGFQNVLQPLSPTDGLQPVWYDDFAQEGPPDPSKWGYDVGGHGWGNNELQHYTSRTANAWVSDGTLKIRAIREAFEHSKYTSARLVTKSKGDWLYGRIEVKARLPTARGSWPAIWMLPTDWEYGDWPRSGEIDIMEHVGCDCGVVHGTVHTDKYNHMKQTQVGKQVPLDVTQWHVYTVDWSDSRIDFAVDGRTYHRFEDDGSGSGAWPFNKRFHLVLNVAVGGDWGGMKGIDEGSFHGDGQVMEIASVRAYAKA